MATDSLLNIQEIQICSELPNFSSIRNAAQALSMDPSRLSRIVKDVEEKLGHTLIKKGPSGITFTSEFLSLSQECHELYEKIQNINGLLSSSKRKFKKTLTIGAHGFIIQLICPEIIAHFEKSFREYRFNFLDLSPNEIIELSKKGVLDIALTTHDENLHKRLIKSHISTIRWMPFIRKRHPLNSDKKSPLVTDYSVVAPIYFDGHKVVTSDLNLYMKNEHSKERKRLSYGHCSQTASVALGICYKSDHIAYVPEFTSIDLLRSGKISKLPKTYKMEEKKQKLNLFIDQDRIEQKFYIELQYVLKKLFKGLKNEINRIS